MSNDLVMTQYEEKVKAKNHLPLRMGYLTDFMVTKASKELGETEEKKAKRIMELRKLLKEQSQIACPKDDAFLLIFLRARKFDVKKAFQLLQNLFQLKKSHKDLYGAYDPDLLRRVLVGKVLYCLPYRDSEGCAVFVCQMWRWNPDTLKFGECYIGTTLSLLSCIEDPATQVCGVRLIIDVKGATFRQMRCIIPGFVNIIAKSLRNCFPARFKGIHIYNENVIFHPIISLMKMLVSDKIISRLHFHGDNAEDLYKWFPKIIMPDHYGGDYPLDVYDWFNAEIEQYFERYAELMNYGFKE